jgi:hypothetical protein
MAATTGSSFSRKRETVAEKAAQCTAEQRRLKESAAASRAKAATAGAKPPARVVKSKAW